MAREKRKGKDAAANVRMFLIGFSSARKSLGVMRKGHAHGEIELNYMLSGFLRYILGGHIFTIGSGQMGLFWGGIPHRILEADPHAEMIFVTIPVGWFLQWSLPDPFVHSVLQGDAFIDMRPEDGALSMRWCDDIRSFDRERRKTALLEIEARLRRMYFQPSAATPQGDPCAAASRPASGIGKVTEIVQYLSRRYTQPIGMRDIARAVSLHPNYAMHVFKRECGMTIHVYLTGLRISHAQYLLATTTAKIVDVALRSGFRSESRFYEAFHAVVGMTPKSYRLAIQRVSGRSA